MNKGRNNKKNRNINYEKKREETATVSKGERVMRLWEEWRRGVPLPENKPLFFSGMLADRRTASNAQNFFGEGEVQIVNNYILNKWRLYLNKWQLHSK